MSKLKNALQNQEAKGINIDINPSYAMMPSARLGYKGLLELAHRSGKLKTLYAHEVKENDEIYIRGN
jgi:recombinational DNA repair protein RecT